MVYMHGIFMCSVGYFENTFSLFRNAISSPEPLPQAEGMLGPLSM